MKKTIFIPIVANNLIDIVNPDSFSQEGFWNSNRENLAIAL